MTSIGSVLKNLILPAGISFLLFLFGSYVVIPLWQHYRGRYSRYLPVESIGTQSLSLRQRLQNLLAGFLLPSSWRSDYQPNRLVANTGDRSNNSFDEDDGEELYEVDENRREAISLDARRGHGDDERRLSRDLEEGFRDDSDDDEPAIHDGQTIYQTR